MRFFLMVVSYLGLGLTVAPAFLVFAGTLAWTSHATLMAVGALLWFATAPFWLSREETKA